jgi:hypothetical protein
MAYDRIEPIGDERADLRSAIVAYLIAAANFKGSHKVEDFMAVRQPKLKQTWQQMRDLLMRFK